MRTKALLLGAAIGAVSLATSMAQVYSVNIVGYINLTIQPGLQMVANQLNNPAGNTIANLIPNPPTLITVYKFNGTGYDGVPYDPDLGGWDPSASTVTLNPGEGCFIDYAGTAPFTNTLVGDVVLTSSLSIPAGLSIISSVIPQEVAWDTIEFPAAAMNLCTVYRFNRASGQYDGFPYDPDLGGWGGNPPVISVGEAVFIDAQNAASWARTFTVGP